MKELINEVAKAVSAYLKEDIMSTIKRELDKLHSQESNKILTIKEASQFYKVHPNTIRNWISRNELQSERVGGKVYITIK